MININTLEELLELFKEKEQEDIEDDTCTYSNLNINLEKKCLLDSIPVKANIIFRNCIINNLSISIEINSLIFDYCVIRDFDIVNSEICDTLIFYNCKFEKPDSVELVDVSPLVINSSIYVLFFKDNRYDSKCPSFRKVSIDTFRILDEKIEFEDFIFYCYETNIDTIQVNDVNNYKALVTRGIKGTKKVLIEDSAAESVRRYNIYKFGIPKYKTATIRYEEEEPGTRTDTIDHYVHPCRIFPVSIDILTVYYDELLDTVKISNIYDESTSMRYKYFQKLALTPDGLNANEYSSIFYLYYSLKDVIYKDKKYFDLYDAFLGEEVMDWRKEDCAKNRFEEYESRILCWYRESYLRKHFILICNYINRVKEINAILENIEEKY